MGHLGVERILRARRVIGRASERAQCLRIMPGRRSGPVAFVASMEVRRRRVQRVRRREKFDMVGVVSSSCVGVGGVGVAVSRKFRLKVVAKRLAFAAASCVQLPCSSLREGMEVGAAALLRSCRLSVHHCFEFLGSCLSLLRSFSLYC